jgi:hypothetical protein
MAPASRRTTVRITLPCEEPDCGGTVLFEEADTACCGHRLFGRCDGCHTAYSRYAGTVSKLSDLLPPSSTTGYETADHHELTLAV